MTEPWRGLESHTSELVKFLNPRTPFFWLSVSLFLTDGHFIFFSFIGVQLTFSIVWVSTVQQGPFSVPLPGPHLAVPVTAGTKTASVPVTHSWSHHHCFCQKERHDASNSAILPVWSVLDPKPSVDVPDGGMLMSQVQGSLKRQMERQMSGLWPSCLSHQDSLNCWFFIFLTASWGLWDLSSPTRDWTCASCSGNAKSWTTSA